MTIIDISRLTKSSWGTIKDIDKTYLTKKYRHIDYKDLEYIAIDEFAIAKGHTYQTIVMNLGTGQILYSAEGKSSDSLTGFWDLLGPKRCRKIKAVGIDMSRAFTKAVRQNLPKADIVYDHFHIVKQLQDTLSTLRRKIFYSLETTNDKKVIKGTRWLLLKKNENLNEKKDERVKLSEALKLNQPLFTAYYLKEEFRLLFHQKDRESGAKFFGQWIAKLMSSNISDLKRLAKIFINHRQGILNWFTHRITSAKIEGTNNKIKVMKRKGYGYRDISYFNLKLFDLHTS